MAYNNGFPVTYPQMYYPQYQQQYQQPVMPQQNQPQQNSIIWVQGEAGAKSHLVAPNTTVPLWDSEAQRIFLKSADAAGMPTMKILNYTIEETPSVAAPVQRAVNGPISTQAQSAVSISTEAETALKSQINALKSDFEAMRTEMESFRGDLYGIAGKKSNANKKKEAVNDD